MQHNPNVVSSSVSSNHTQNHIITTVANSNNSNNNTTIEIKQQPQQTATIQIQSPNQTMANAQVCLNTMDLNDVDVRTFLNCCCQTFSFFFKFCVCTF